LLLCWLLHLEIHLRQSRTTFNLFFSISILDSFCSAIDEQLQKRTWNQNGFGCISGKNIGLFGKNPHHWRALKRHAFHIAKYG
jgi:hypothetical protein